MNGWFKNIAVCLLLFMMVTNMHAQVPDSVPDTSFNGASASSATTGSFGSAPNTSFNEASTSSATTDSFGSTQHTSFNEASTSSATMDSFGSTPDTSFNEASTSSATTGSSDKTPETSFDKAPDTPFNAASASSATTGSSDRTPETSLGSAREPNENIDNANAYLDSKTASLDKYLGRSNGIQQRLLKRLQRKEQRMLKKLAARDSALYYQYVQQQGLSYDSIAALSNDTAYRNKLALQKNSTIDSLKGVQRFIQNQHKSLGSAREPLLNVASASSATAGIERFDNAREPLLNVASAGSAAGELSSLQQQLNVQQNIDQLIQQKTQSLKNFASQHTSILRQSSGAVKGLEGIQKDVYYAREKIKNWRELADEPDDAEAAALEYLQGTEGFDKFLKQESNAFGGLGNNATAADLQRMGYQTKSSVNAMLQKSLGNNLGTVQQQMGQQVQQYSEQLNGITQKVNEVKGSIADAKQGLQSAKDAKNNLKSIAKPDFKINPEKGKPFWQRLEWQYNFQTARASVDGLKPAMMDIGMNVGYKQNERLSFGIGLSSSLGLGQSWQHIRFSYEGISTRAYADWKWVYGFSFQAGYERSFIPANKAYLPENAKLEEPNPQTQNTDNILKDAFGGQQQTAYLGIMKRYHINSKWSGTFLAGYNFLWQQEGQRSPWLLRFGWGK